MLGVSPRKMDEGLYPFQPGWEEQEVARSKRRCPEPLQAARMQKVGVSWALQRHSLSIFQEC